MVAAMRVRSVALSSLAALVAGVVIEEPGGHTPWLLWMLADGWSIADHGDTAACPTHQTDPILKSMRFID